MTEITQMPHSQEVHHYQHSAPEQDERMVSVELTQGQSGKRGCTVKAYGPTVAVAMQRAKEGFVSATQTIEEE